MKAAYAWRRTPFHQATAPRALHALLMSLEPFLHALAAVLGGLIPEHTGQCQGSSVHARTAHRRATSRLEGRRSDMSLVPSRRLGLWQHLMPMVQED